LAVSFYTFICSAVFGQIHLIEKDDTTAKAVTNVAAKVLQIIEEQPEAIEDWIEDRVYLAPHRIAVTHRGAFLHHRSSAILLPPFAMDEKGIFILCKKKDAEQEALEHYDRGKQAFLEVLEHSIYSGISIECPPIAIFEGYRAVEAWKEWAREYRAAREEEEKGTYTRPEPKSSRDD